MWFNCKSIKIYRGQYKTTKIEMNSIAAPKIVGSFPIPTLPPIFHFE